MQPSDEFRRILREMPSRGWMNVSTCRHGDPASLIPPGRVHRSRKSYVILLLSNRPEMRINAARLNARAGRTIALIGPDSTWELSATSGPPQPTHDARAWACLASPVWRTEPGPAAEPGLMLISEHGPFTRYEEQLTTIYHELLDSRGQFRRGLCSSLFHSLAAEIVLNAWDLARPSYTRNDILRLCGEMRAQPERRFRLSDLAEMAGVSPRQLRRVFVSEIGMTPKEFEIESRMAHAEFLLANQGLKVREVAHACGYSDPFLFSRQFSKLRDRNPSSYRSGQPMSTSGNPIPRPD